MAVYHCNGKIVLMSRYLILQGLKLTDSEKAVLRAVEEQKMGRHASKIARSAGVPGTTAIHTLEKLVRWKLVRKIRMEKHWTWLNNKMLK